MQTLNPKPKKKRNNHVGIKYVLTSFSLISTIGLWQFFSNNDVLKEVLAANSETDPVNNQIQFQPLPTLATIASGTINKDSSSPVSVNNSDLREVTAPTSQPVVQPRIAIQQVIINNPVNSSNGNTITRTGSSR